MDWVAWSLRRLKKASIEIHSSQTVRAGDIRHQLPDGVILACGAYPVVFPIPGLDSKIVADARDVLTGKVEPKGPVVILGAGYVGMETADYLLAKGIAVTVLEMQTAIRLFDFSVIHCGEEFSGVDLLTAFLTTIETQLKEFAEQVSAHYLTRVPSTPHYSLIVGDHSL